MTEYNVSLRSFNTFGLDVTAKVLSRIGAMNDLQAVISENLKKNEPLLILGGGSNMLFTRNVDGLVLKNELSGIAVTHEDAETITICAGAGVRWHRLVMHCVDHGWGGIENLSLIPGNVGAAPMQNIGAYGVELKDVFHSLEAVHLKTGDVRHFTPSECAFGYRESIFKHSLKGAYIITSVSLKLRKQPQLNTSYGAIGQELESMGVLSPTVKDVSQAVINIRRSKLPDPEKLGNAGSFFKNPVVSREQFETLIGNYPKIPAYPADSKVKLAAGWLIEQCGWKGKVVGKTGSHRDQALVLVNYGGATGAEILQLSEDIMRSVFDTFGVQLEREVNVY
jgi:UDP-N-acetylmuramate dehydrogenase